MRNISRSFKSKKAFTFLEMMIAFAIILAGIVPVFTLTMTGNRSFMKTENNSVAYNLAIEALEWVHSAPFEEIKTENVNKPPGARYSFPVKLDMNYETKETCPPAPYAKYKLEYPQKYFKYFSNFSREMLIEDFGNKTKKVTITVKWQEDGVERKEQVNSIIVDQRLNN